MIGLDALKNSIAEFFSLIEMNYSRELSELVPLQVSLNRVFLVRLEQAKPQLPNIMAEFLSTWVCSAMAKVSLAGEDIPPPLIFR